MLKITIKTAGGVAALALATTLTAPALAAPTTYQFSTIPGMVVGSPLTALLGGAPALAVSGTFRYDPAAPLLGTSESLGYEAGAAVYSSATPPARAFTGLQGQVGAFSFSDPGGSAAVGNQQYGGKDILSLNADPSPLPSGWAPAGFGRQLTGFSLGELTLFNVRLLWIEGQLDGVAFLDSNAMPAKLPTFHGRVALDFVPAAQLAPGYQGPYTIQSVFLGGLQAQAVPEPQSLVLLMAGLGCIAVAARRRQPAA